MRNFYCSNCGTRLTVFRKALKKYATIIDMVEPHECLDEPVELNLSPVEIPPFDVPRKGKFVENLNDLDSSPAGSIKGLRTEPGDKRSADHIRNINTTTAPVGLLERMELLRKPEEP